MQRSKNVSLLDHLGSAGQHHGRDRNPHGFRRLVSLWDTTAWTIPESVKPSISGHRISHPIANAMLRACIIASINDTSLTDHL
jgi:hypothetical protein